MGDCLFFRGDGSTLVECTNLPSRFQWEMWRPGFFRFKPRGVAWMPYGVWRLFHSLRVFSNRDYAVFVIYEDGALIHRSTVTPGYFRFPFMRKADLQIGDTWTREDYRGQGLARFAIQQILQACSNGARVYWYLVDSDNVASIRAAERAGLRAVGTGIRKKRLGLRVLGCFDLESLEDRSVGSAPHNQSNAKLDLND